MALEALLATINPTQFTGYEHTQIVSLLTVLSLVSVAVWALVLLSLIVRSVTIHVLRRQLRRRSRELAAEVHHGS